MRRPLSLLCVTCLFLGFLGQAAGAQVTMPLAEYQALRARANPDADPDPEPPAPFAFETADLVITADGERARIVQTLGLTLFADGWQKVPLGEAGSFIAAKFGDLDGRVNVANDSEGGWSLQVQGRGRHQVVLESVVPVRRDETATRPTWQLGLRLPPAAVVRGRIEAPGTVEEVELQGAGLVRRGDPGEHSWSFVAAPTPEPVGFTLRGRRTLPGARRPGGPPARGRGGGGVGPRRVPALGRGPQPRRPAARDHPAGRIRAGRRPSRRRAREPGSGRIRSGRSAFRW